MRKELDEPILPDDYPIYGDYLYIADGKAIRSNWHDITAREFKAREHIRELRRCDIVGRQIQLEEKERARSKNDRHSGGC